MATSGAKSGDFIANLGKIYGMYTGGFAAFVIFLAILEQVGVPNQISATCSCSSRSASTPDRHHVAHHAGVRILRRRPQGAGDLQRHGDGRRLDVGASFVGMAGTLYALGYDGLAFVLGWTGGYVLVAVLVAPYLRKFGAYTVPDFLGALRRQLRALLGVIVLFCLLLHLCDGADLRHRHHRLALPRHVVRIAVFVGLSRHPASARCSAACAR
jgi:cation/acetate symporter